jgi:hypothetical protein
MNRSSTGTSHHDLDTRLRALPAPAVPDLVRRLQRERLRSTAAGSSASPGVRWHRRWVVAAVGAAGVIGGGASVAVAAITIDRATDRVIAHCFPSVSTNFGSAGPGLDVNTTSSDTAATALSLCSAAWSSGLLRPTTPYIGEPSRRGQFPVPALVACVLPTGEVGVFPGASGICQHLSLGTSIG